MWQCRLYPWEQTRDGRRGIRAASPDTHSRKGHKMSYLVKAVLPINTSARTKTPKQCKATTYRKVEAMFSEKKVGLPLSEVAFTENHLRECDVVKPVVSGRRDVATSPDNGMSFLTGCCCRWPKRLLPSAPASSVEWTVAVVCRQGRSSSLAPAGPRRIYVFYIDPTAGWSDNNQHILDYSSSWMVRFLAN